MDKRFLSKKAIDDMLEKNPFFPIGDAVYELIRQAIISLELFPGQRIKEEDITSLLEVSRTPVREAIKRLQKEYYVTKEVRKGTFVTNISSKDLIEMLYLRYAVERMITRIALKRIGDAGLEELRLCSEKLCMFAESVDRSNLMKYDIQFHQIIFHATQNRYLLDIDYLLRAQVNRLRVFYVSHAKEESLKQLGMLHFDIYAAIRDRDVERAEAAAWGHTLHMGRENGLDMEDF